MPHFLESILISLLGRLFWWQAERIWKERDKNLDGTTRYCLICSDPINACCEHNFTCQWCHAGLNRLFPSPESHDNTK